MGKIEIDTGHPSTMAHRLTQVSTTLDRRYVQRPSNLIVDAAARDAHLHCMNENTDETATIPSRLVNLGVCAADLAKAQTEANEKLARAKQPIMMTSGIIELGGNVATDNNATGNDVTEPIKPVESTESTNTLEVPSPTASAATTKVPEPTEEIDTTTLAANIAADYAATVAEHTNVAEEYANTVENRANADTKHTDTLENHTNMMPEEDSVEAIALAASNAIASIREATEPDQVSTQVASLKAFAENIKTNSDLPEMRELGDTIDKFVNIAMKSTKLQEEAKHNTTKPVTLSPKINRAADKVTRSSAKIMNAKRPQATKTLSPKTSARTAKMPLSRKNSFNRNSSLTAKNHAVEKAMLSVATMADNETTAKPTQKVALPRKKTGIKRLLIAVGCAAACVAAVTSIVGANIPDISVRVAAMQTGIQASYPSYVPRDYTLAGISSEDGKIIMNFTGPDNASFKLIEEKSSWDSSALLRNYVEPNWKDDYATTHEQGITIYIANSNSDAAWVNGGVLYKITSSGTSLTKKQVRSIVTSL